MHSFSSGTCSASCGGPSSGGLCYCDKDCAKYEDCCSDYTHECGKMQIMISSIRPRVNIGTKCTLAQYHTKLIDKHSFCHSRSYFLMIEDLNLVGGW